MTSAPQRLGDYPGTRSVVQHGGHVSHELLAVADEVDADIVVLGHRSHGPIRDAILGSVAARTVHSRRRTVMVAIQPT